MTVYKIVEIVGTSPKSWNVGRAMRWRPLQRLSKI